MEEPRHSGLGISSFIIGTAIGILMFMLVMIAGIMQATTAGGVDGRPAVATLLGLFLFVFLLFDVVGVGLGIAGVLQRNRKKVLSVLGIVFSATTILLTIALIVLGSVA